LFNFYDDYMQLNTTSFVKNVSLCTRIVGHFYVLRLLRRWCF